METPSAIPIAQTFQGSLVLDIEGAPSGNTRIRKCYRSGLFHVGKPYWDGQQLVLQLVNPTAGVFENDKLDSRITLSAGARACLLSPSSTQVYTMPSGSGATSYQTITLSDGASLAFMPKWLVLHKGSRFKQLTQIDLDPTSCLFYLDLLSAGRASFGEFLEYDQFSSATEIRLGGKRILKERLTCGRHHNRWVWGNDADPFSYLANAYIAFQGAAGICEAILPRVPAYAGAHCSMGFTALNPDFVSLRLLGHSSADVQQGLKDICQLLEDWVPVSSVFQRIS